MVAAEVFVTDADAPSECEAVPVLVCVIVLLGVLDGVFVGRSVYVVVADCDAVRDGVCVTVLVRVSVGVRLPVPELDGVMLPERVSLGVTLVDPD
jgi:hypothetical protein